MSILIKANNITKCYKTGKDSLYALNDVSLNINEGDFIAILGPSGSGKSTLMNIIGGLDKPDTGTIEIDGQDLMCMKETAMSKYRNKVIGFVFQSFNLDGSLTALENVMLPLMYAKISRSKRREMAMEALKNVGLSDRMTHKPTELSGGQKQRVSVARAIVNNPRIILADEPTGNLDKASGEMVISMLKDLNKKGYTVLMVTHNGEQAKSANRIIEISDGMITSDISNVS